MSNSCLVRRFDLLQKDSSIFHVEDSFASPTHWNIRIRSRLVHEITWIIEPISRRILLLLIFHPLLFEINQWTWFALTAPHMSFDITFDQDLRLTVRVFCINNLEQKRYHLPDLHAIIEHCDWLRQDSNRLIKFNPVVFWKQVQDDYEWDSKSEHNKRPIILNAN